MTNELDKFFNSFEEQEKIKQEINRQAWGKQKVFIAAFKQSLDKIIHPAMIKIIDTFRKRGGFGLVVSERRKKSNPMTHIKGYDVPPKADAQRKILYKHYENYYISGKPVVEVEYLQTGAEFFRTGTEFLRTGVEFPHTGVAFPNGGIMFPNVCFKA